ncbi:MAG: AAA family ATPase [Methylotetracoccus sp.]
MSEDTGRELIRGLLRAEAYPHATGTIEVRETHISWIILTGSFAYKIKKPVNFGFVDFSTADRRRFFCEEEVRLNRRLAPGLYLGVVTITGSATTPRISGDGPVLEHAVRLRQFDPNASFDRLAHTRSIEANHIDRLADLLASFHRTAPKASRDSPWGTAESTGTAMRETLDELARRIDSPVERRQLVALIDWNERRESELRRLLEQRKAGGFIRECHGDLHLGNLVMLDGEPTPFDCLEFNASLRWIDIVSEIAFLTMDLHISGAGPLAYRFIDRYEQAVGDYAGLRLLRYYQVYRALVRAKVAALSSPPNRGGITDEDSERVRRAYLDYACMTAGCRPTAPGASSRSALLVTHGLSGSGKSSLAAQIAERLPAIRLRSDVERKRLFADDRNGPDAPHLYSANATRRTYRRLAKLAATVLDLAMPIIIDATFLARWQRDTMHELARRHGIPFVVLDLVAPTHLLRERIRKRASDGADPSDATEAVLMRQIALREELAPDEEPARLAIDAAAPDIEALLSAIRERCNRLIAPP